MALSFGAGRTTDVLFDYRQTRSGKHPAEILSGFPGCLQVDGHAGYGRIPNVTLIG